MIRLFLALVPLALALGFGYFIGQRGKRKALTEAYGSVLPVAKEARAFVACWRAPVAEQSRSLALQAQLLEDALDAYDTGRRVDS